MTTLIPRLLAPGLLPLAELLALCLDGQLYRIGGAFATLDTPESAALRADAFAVGAPRGTIADRGTAAWIHGTRPEPPRRLQVCVDAKRRGGRLPSDVDGRECVLAPGDTTRFGGVLVTSPGRTAMDLLLTEKRFPPEKMHEVRYLLWLSGDDAAALTRRLRRRPRPGSARAIERLERLSEGTATVGAAIALSPR
jgi:hypothetical protein